MQKHRLALRFVSFSLVLSFGLSSIIPSQAAFLDVRSSHDLYPSVQYFINKGILSGNGRFYPDRETTHKLFWMLVVSESGFSDSTVNIPLPPNIEESDEIAPYLRQAVSMGILSAAEDFPTNEPITELEGLKYILEAKDIDPPKRPSPSFRRRVGLLSPRSGAIRYMEAGFASEILTSRDVQTFAPHRNLTRRKLVQWLYNHVEAGEKKESVTDTLRYRINSPNRQSYRNSSQRRTSSSTASSAQKELLIPDGKILQGVLDQIESRYRFPEEVTQEKKRQMVNAGIRAMVQALGDKYTNYIQPEDVAKFKENLDGTFEGIGAFVDMVDGKFTIQSPIKGSPAEAVGIEAGDVVTQVDEEDISDLDLHSIINMIKGPAGTEVDLKIQRGTQLIDFTVVRGKITVPALDLTWKDSVPIIGLHQFNRDTGSKLREMIRTEIFPKDPRGIVIDVRNNPGGYLTTAVQISGLFLEEGTELFHVEHKTQKQTYKAPTDGMLKDYENIVILQNKGSASASEIIASVLQDYRRATIVGSPSLGKGTVQDIMNFTNGGVLKLTIAKWLSPKGNWIHETGVIPDVEVEPQTPEQRKADIDPPLDAAVNEILKRN